MWHTQGERKLVFVKQLHLLTLVERQDLSISSTHQSVPFIGNTS
jgi:hypothetical protein